MTILKPCSRRKDEPIGYVASYYWRLKMSVTHTAKQCKKCGLYHIWVRKNKKQ